MASSAFPFGAPRPAAAVRLVCLPFAGGSAAVFRGLVRLVPPSIDVLPLELPGRGARFGEPPASHMDTLLERLVDDLAPLADRPLALLGHSLGGRVAFELARRLPIVHVFATACSAPSLPRAPVALGASDAQLLEVLRRLEGTPPEFFAVPELVELFLPVVRADFTLLDHYHQREAAAARSGVRIAAPVTVIRGTEDSHVSEADADAWRAHTTGAFRAETVVAGHFFLATHGSDVARVVARDLGAA